MKLSRRTFLRAAAGLGAVLASGGGGLYWLLFGGRKAAAGFHVLSPGEVDTARSVAEGLFPPGPPFGIDGRRARLAEALDAHLPWLPAREQRLVRAGLRAIEYEAVLTHGGRFSRLPLGARIAALRGWEASRHAGVNASFRALKLLFGMFFFERDDVRRTLGWSLGCTPSTPA